MVVYWNYLIIDTVVKFVVQYLKIFWFIHYVKLPSKSRKKSTCSLNWNIINFLHWRSQDGFMVLMSINVFSLIHFLHHHSFNFNNNRELWSVSEDALIWIPKGKWHDSSCLVRCHKKSSQTIKLAHFSFIVSQYKCGYST